VDGTDGAAFASDPTSLKGKPMPNITMKKLGGGSVSVGSLKGKVVVLDFWATWCVPCVAAGPTMESLFNKYSKKGLVILGTNVSDSTAKVSAYVAKHKYSYPFTVDNVGIAGKLGVSALPVFVFIDRKGVVQRVDTGFDAGSAASWDKTLSVLLR
jgi:thiol-disulfide isomerase/thioredoxin